MKTLALLLALTASAAPAGKPAPAPQLQEVRLKTSDGWALAARYRPPVKGAGVAILVHGVGAGKGEWAPLEEELARRGLGSLALDLRGHGDSQKGAFAWPSALEDLVAASRWLAGRGVPARRTGFVGGSIGANLSSQAAALVGARWLVMLSPGFDYRGVPCAPLKTPALAAAAPGDEYALRTARALAGKGAVLMETKGGHGAQMLIQPDFLDKLGAWIEQASQGRFDTR